MRKIIVLLVALFAVSATYGQGIEFQGKSYDEVLKMAKKQKKLIFVDIFTSWCGPCKHMSANIFTQEKAGTFYNAHFLNIKLDAEKSDDGKKVASKFGVNAYPTFLFINGDGELVYRFLGGRTVDQFVDEGQKALNAFAAKPLLEKYAKKYAKGKRDKEFLVEYFELKDKAGLDCSDVLMDYFAQLKDEELVDTLNVKRIAKMTVYEPVLAGRLVNAICQCVKASTDKKQVANAKKSITTYMSACLKNVAKSDDETLMEEVLTLKDKLFQGADISESVTAATLGGGNIYIPSNLLRLDYYGAKNKKELFVPLFEKHIAGIVAKFEKDAVQKAALEEEMNKKMEEAKKQGKDDEYKSMKRMKGMMFAFSGIDDYYSSTQMLEHIEKYVQFYEGKKDKAFEDKIVDWYQAMHRVCPSVKSAVYIADKLMEMNRKSDAIATLEFGLEKGSEAMGVEDADREACQAKLDELRK